MTNLAKFTPPILIVLTLVLVAVTGCPSKGPKTPEAAFQATLDAVEARDFRSEWRRMSGRLRTEWARGIDVLKRSVEADPSTREACAQMIRKQYDTTLDEFLATDPRDLHARYLEVNRQQILKFSMAGEVRIEGERAFVPVRLLDDDRPVDFVYVLKGGKWLLDQGIKDRR
jgi:hypothetical protein